jgi:hypothetical protein
MVTLEVVEAISHETVRKKGSRQIRAKIYAKLAPFPVQ